MPGVPRELTEHTLNIDPKFKPVKQFLRQFNEDRCKAIGEEVARLLAAGFIVEVFHPEWLANPVLVLKKMALGACVGNTQTLIRPTRLILLLSLVLIKLLMLPQDTSHCVSSMHTPATTKHIDSLIDDLRLTFDNLRTYDIKLNP